MINELTNATTLEELEIIKENFEAKYLTQKKHIELCESINKIKKSDFYSILNIFENITPNLFVNKNGQVIINKFTNIIKENNDLSKMFLIYNAVHKDGINKQYINEMFNVVGIVNECNIGNDIDNLIEILLQGVEVVDYNDLLLNPQIDSDLCKALHHKTTQPKTIHNIDDTVNNDLIINNFLDNKEKATPQTSIKYNEDLELNNEDEVDVFNKLVFDGMGQEEIFEHYKKNCLIALDASIVKESDESINIIKNGLIEKIYNVNTFVDDLDNLIKLKNTINE